jgi:CRP-like cAMP-binding protein
LNEGDFFGEGGLAGQPLRMGSATAMTDCELLRIDKKAMMLALHREHTFSDLFVAYLLARNIRYEEDLVDQLFNSSEQRLARILLLLAHFGKEGVPETVNSQDQSGNPSRDDRHNPVTSQFFHESV